MSVEVQLEPDVDFTWAFDHHGQARSLELTDAGLAKLALAFGSENTRVELDVRNGLVTVRREQAGTRRILEG